MERTPACIDLSFFPEQLHCFLENVPVFDSSCSKEARVWFLDLGPGFYLKTAVPGSLEREARLDRFFHQKGLGPRVETYFSEEADWLLTEAVPGEDCTHRIYLEEPKQLCDTTASLLRSLHETAFSGCPVPDRTADYLKSVHEGYARGKWEPELFTDCWEFSGPEEAISLVNEQSHRLKADTLLHGDYCLPNIILNNWCFSSFIDLGCGGVGDRHIDLLWGVWTLQFNLCTNRWKDRFLDAYGRDAMEEDMLPLIAACEMLG